MCVREGGRGGGREGRERREKREPDTEPTSPPTCKLQLAHLQWKSIQTYLQSLVRNTFLGSRIRADI